MWHVTMEWWNRGKNFQTLEILFQRSCSKTQFEKINGLNLIYICFCCGDSKVNIVETSFGLGYCELCSYQSDRVKAIEDCKRYQKEENS